MANTTYYVDTDSGNDTTGDGLSWGTAWKSLFKAESLNLDLTSGATDGVCTIYCRGTAADTTAVTWDGWTTDADGYVNVVGDFYGTAWDATKYHLSPTNATRTLFINDQYIRINHIQISNTGLSADRDCVSIASIAAGGSDIRFVGCYIRGSASDTGFGLQTVVIGDADATVYFINCIIAFAGDPADTGSTAMAISNCADAYIYNCVVGYARLGINRSAGNVTVKNTAVLDTANDFNGTITIDYCASDDNDGTNVVAESGGGSGWPSDFTDAANGDFSLKLGSGLIGTATVDPGSGLYSDDIKGTARGAAWDVGAHEYVAAAAGLSIPVGMAYYAKMRRQ